MLTARDVMTRDVVAIAPDVPLEEAIRTLLDNKVSGLPVVDEERHVVGMITEKDILNFIFSGHIPYTKVGDAMTRQVISFPPDAELDKICLAIGEHHIRRVPIIEDGRLIGIISRRSIIRTVLSMPSRS